MLPTCLILALMLPSAPADTTPRLRELCIRAPVVVLARPVDPTNPTNFKVVATLRGKDFKPGDPLRPLGLTEADMRSSDGIDPETKKPRYRRIDLALLFLTPARSNSEFSPYRVMSAGFRLCTDDDRVLAPAIALGLSSGEPLQIMAKVKWHDLMRIVRDDVAVVERLHAARSLTRPTQRVRALTEWVQRRRSELSRSPSATPSDLSPAGWYELTSNVFQWIFEDASTEQAWEAVRLYASLHRGEVPRLKRPVFASQEGRAFLAQVALDERALTGDRCRALELLSAPATLAKMELKDRSTLLDKLQPALTSKDETLLVPLAHAIVQLSRDGDGKPGKPSSELLTALTGGYRATNPGPAHDELAWALCQLAPGQYGELTRNPPGVCARLVDFTHEDDEITFFLDLRLAEAKTFTQPTLVIEALGKANTITKTVRTPLVVVNLITPWTAGVGDGILAVRLALPKILPAPEGGQFGRQPALARYRIRVEGTIGKGSSSRVWRSEPKMITVRPNRPGR